MESLVEALKYFRKKRSQPENLAQEVKSALKLNEDPKFILSLNKGQDRKIAFAIIKRRPTTSNERSSEPLFPRRRYADLFRELQAQPLAGQ